MKNKPRVFVDTSAIFAAVLSDSGGGREILKLGAIGAIQVIASQRVFVELEAVILKKAQNSLKHFALLLDEAKIEIVPEGRESELNKCNKIVTYEPDRRVLASALRAEPDFFATLDKKHFLLNKQLDKLPFPRGTPGDFLKWFRDRFR